MNALDKKAKTLLIKCVNIEIEKQLIKKQLAHYFLNILLELEKGKLKKSEADGLFGNFLPYGYLFDNKFEDIIVDGASLELPPEALKFRPEVNIKDLKKRCLQVLR